MDYVKVKTSVFLHSKHIIRKWLGSIYSVRLMNHRITVIDSESSIAIGIEQLRMVRNCTVV